VRASATACSAVRNERCTSVPLAVVAAPNEAAMARPYSTPTSSAIASASARGMRDRRLAEQGDEQVVVAHRQLDVDRVGTNAGSAFDGRPAPAPSGPLDPDLDVAATDQLVEVVAGDVGVQLEALGDLCGGDAAPRIAHEQVHVAPRRIAESTRDRGDSRGELRRREGGRSPCAGKFTTRGPHEALIIDALRPVEDPELHRSIVDLGMVKQVTIDGGHVQVLIAPPVPGCPLRAEIDSRVASALRTLADVTLHRRRLHGP